MFVHCSRLIGYEEIDNLGNTHDVHQHGLFTLNVGLVSSMNWRALFVWEVLNLFTIRFDLCTKILA